MRVTKLIIKNYRSFSATGAVILFPSAHCALVGKNNSGKTNILKALNTLLGFRNPRYIKFEVEDFYDPNAPIEFTITIGDFNPADSSALYSLPGLTKPQQGALSKHLTAGAAEINLSLKKIPELTSNDDEDAVSEQDGFELTLWGFTVHRKVEDVRHSLLKMLMVPALRDYEDELTASKYTQYGQLMKEVLEGSANYATIKTLLQKINSEIQSALSTEKTKLLADARIASYVEDIEFQLTKDNEPSELLRNLEVFIKENGKLFNISNVGTGTQNAIIIGILELALKSKGAKCKLFGIEEPEAFIHPHGIRYLGNLIKNITKDGKTQVMISTHSLSLVSHFEPTEIIKVDKVSGESVICQNTSLSETHFKRFVNQGNAEIFFSDCLIFVEGATEKHLFYNLDKHTKQNPAIASSEDCNFDRINMGVIEMGSKNNILNYIQIAESFNIPYAAILDNDFINSGICSTLCRKFSLAYNIGNPTQLIADLKTKNILIIPQGEIEDLFPDTDIATISGKTASEVATAKSSNPGKASRAFKTLFSPMGKPEYAILIADYYINNNLTCPLENLIRKLYFKDFPNIIF